MFVTQKAIVWNDEGKMLALRRSNTDPSRPLTWDLPGGVLEEGEDIKEAMRREIREEAGLETTDLRVRDVVASTGHDGNYWVMILYEASKVQGQVELSFEHDQYEWITLKEFLTRKSSKKIVKVLRDYESIRSD